MQNTLQLEYIRSNGLEIEIMLCFVLISEASESIFYRSKNASTPQDNDVNNKKKAFLERSIPENSSLLIIVKD
jgi:hypothetical protein